MSHWADRALCQQVSGDLFYPELGEDTEKVKRVCRACEVRLPCLEYALEIEDRDGIFGGFTERVRRRIARDVQDGVSLEDIIAEDDAAFYARLDRSAELAEAAAERKRVQGRAKAAAARARVREEVAA